MRCGDTWIVPHALARGPRASRRGRGISRPDHLGFGMTTNASASMQLDLAKQRGDRLDATLSTVSVMGTCLGCGGVDTYVERRA